jgi:hypothetical protein
MSAPAGMARDILSKSDFHRPWTMDAESMEHLYGVAYMVYRRRYTGDAW